MKIFTNNFFGLSTKKLFEWIKGIELEQHEVKTKEGLLQYRFINAISLNDANPDMEVNYFECCIKDKNGEIKSLFTWITDIHITKKNVHELSKGGRARWRIENETFNTLKNQGYNFEHNYGHGYKHLNHVFGLLMFLAFLIDQVQQHSCALFQAALKKMKSRIRLWEKLRSSFTIFHVDSWEIMYAHIASDPRVKLIWVR